MATPLVAPSPFGRVGELSTLQNGLLQSLAKNNETLGGVVGSSIEGRAEVLKGLLSNSEALGGLYGGEALGNMIDSYMGLPSLQGMKQGSIVSGSQAPARDEIETAQRRADVYKTTQEGHQAGTAKPRELGNLDFEGALYWVKTTSSPNPQLMLLSDPKDLRSGTTVLRPYMQDDAVPKGTMVFIQDLGTPAPWSLFQKMVRERLGLQAPEAKGSTANPTFDPYLPAEAGSQMNMFGSSNTVPSTMDMPNLSSAAPTQPTAPVEASPAPPVVAGRPQFGQEITIDQLQQLAEGNPITEHQYGDKARVILQDGSEYERNNDTQTWRRIDRGS